MDEQSRTDTSKRRILYYSEGWGLGGIERFIMNSVELLDRSRYDFDIFCTHDWDTSYDARIAELGGSRYVVFRGHKPNLVARLIASLRAWRILLESGRYAAVHINTMNGVGFTYARVAEVMGVPVRIVHSHSTSYSNPSLPKNMAHKLCKQRYLRSATKLLAATDDAGRYLFDEHPYEIVHTTVDTNVFHHDEEARRRVRGELGVGDDAFLFGSVGRFAAEKNLPFQVEVLAQLTGLIPDARLLLVGAGPEEATIRAKAEELGMTDRLILPGATDRPSDYLSAFDVVSVPSLFESGSPLAVTETLACGCPCVLSAHVDTRALDTPLVRSLEPTDAGAWAQALVDVHEGTASIDRAAEGLRFVRSIGYDNESNRAVINGLYGETQG